MNYRTTLYYLNLVIIFKTGLLIQNSPIIHNLPNHVVIRDCKFSVCQQIRN